MARATSSGESVLANATYWFEHELRQYRVHRSDDDLIADYKQTRLSG
jgi:hypothetical protein